MGIEKIAALRERFRRVTVVDKGRLYNSNLMNTLETGNLLELAEAVLTAALARKESRGGHSRTDFKLRNDEDFLKHTLAYHSGDKPRLEYKPVRITHWKPVERKY
jgi:succinate dehydrogenase / fumarate reductase flavoprotein subunit